MIQKDADSSTTASTLSSERNLDNDLSSEVRVAAPIIQKDANSSAAASALSSKRKLDNEISFEVTVPAPKKPCDNVLYVSYN